MSAASSPKKTSPLASSPAGNPGPRTRPCLVGWERPERAVPTTPAPAACREACTGDTAATDRGQSPADGVVSGHIKNGA
jgi:hypothetical protein